MSGYLDVLDELLADGVSALSARFRRLQADYIIGRQQSDGGFPARHGGSDPYYTDFAARVLALCAPDSPAFAGIARYLQAAPPLRDIIDGLKREPFDLVVVDSIQTTFDSRIESAPGSVGQVRTVALRLIRAAKETGARLVCHAQFRCRRSVCTRQRPDAQQAGSKHTPGGRRTKRQTKSCTSGVTHKSVFSLFCLRFPLRQPLGDGEQPGGIGDGD